VTHRGVLWGATLLPLVAAACISTVSPSDRIPSRSLGPDSTRSPDGSPVGSVAPSVSATRPFLGVDAPRIGAPYWLTFTGITSEILRNDSGTIRQELDAANYDVIDGGELVSGEVVDGTHVGRIKVSTAFPGPAGNPYTAQVHDPVTGDPLVITPRQIGRVDVSFVTDPNPEYSVIEAWWWDADHRRWLDVTAGRADELETIVVELISAGGQSPPNG
jgi:hypothetical protein